MYSSKTCLGALFLAILSLSFFYTTRLYSGVKPVSPNARDFSKAHADVLLLYVFAWNTEYALPNMIYFINHAVRETDPVDYYFILQQVNDTNVDEQILPKLPKNARYIHHENKCFDYGSMGWFFSEYTVGNPYKNDTVTANETSKIDIRKYKYFMFMNASTRGPYYPPYFLTMIQAYEAKTGKKFYWYSVFTERINEKVKLIGPTIGCARTPHVQIFIAATDFIGLSVVFKSANMGSPFDCHVSFEDAITFGELGFTTKILAEGYMIDCMMRKYQRLNFNAPENINCNGRGNPNQIQGVDNISLDPYELVFIKFNYKRFEWEAAERAKIYEKWSEEHKNETAKFK